MKSVHYFRKKFPSEIFGWVLNTPDIQSFWRKTQQKFASCKINSSLTHSNSSISIFLDLWTNLLQCHLYCNVKLFSLQLYLLRDEASHTKLYVTIHSLKPEGQTPAKTLIIQFPLHLSTNKQWLADFKILYISSTFII